MSHHDRQTKPRPAMSDLTKRRHDRRGTPYRAESYPV